MRIRELLNEGYREAKKRFADDADPDTINDVVEKFKDLVHRNQVHGDQKNIDWWAKQGWKEFNAFVLSKTGQSSKTQRKRKQSAGNSVTLHEDDDIFVVIPLDLDASCFHGKDTKWCTAIYDRFYFMDYFHGDETTLVYFFLKDTGDKYACSINLEYPEDSEFFDQDDNGMDEIDFESIVGFDSSQIVEMIEEHPTANSDIEKERKRIGQLYQSTTARVKERINDGIYEQDAQLEDDLVRSANFVQAYYYAKGLYDTQGRQKFSNEFKRLLLNTHNASGIRYIKNVSERDVKVALEFEPRVLENIYKKQEYAHLKPYITDKLLSDVLAKHPRMIVFVQNQKPEWQMNSIKRDPSLIQFLRDPSKSVQEYVIRAEPRYINNLKRVDPSVQKMVIDTYPDRLQKLPYLDMEIQRYAIEQNPFYATRISNLFPEIKQKAIAAMPELEQKLS